MKALSIRQPWAWLIINAGKDIENRSWPTRFRGRFLVHAAKGMTRAEYDDTAEWVALTRNIALPPMAELLRGGIVGAAELVDCVDDHLSPWYMGQKAFVLRDANPLPFVPYKGQLGFFEVDPQALGLDVANV